MRALLPAAILACLCLGCGQASSVGDTTAIPTSPATLSTLEPSPALDDSPTQGPTPTQAPPPAQSDRETARVTRVVDGDTIDVELNGKVARIRYIGIDTPETVDPDSPVECFGHEASEKNFSLVHDRIVVLEKDVSETDRYGRLLRYVYVDGQMVNELLVLGGYASAVTFPPDVKYQDRLAEAQVEAREANRGLWGSCVGIAPTPVVTTSCPEGCVTPPPGCEIKGNINSAGVKIYHVPSGEFYDATIIDALKGERWFCTPDEAIANGWRASQR